MAFVVLYRKLSENEESEDVIFRGHPETDTCWKDLNVNFLSLFML